MKPPHEYFLRTPLLTILEVAEKTSTVLAKRYYEQAERKCVDF